MDTEKLKEKASDPRYIPGIYNYCDRWCERCQFTSRCLNYNLGEEQFPDTESRDAQNQKFWKGLEDSFKATMEMVKEIAAEENLDLSTVDVSDEMKELERRRAEAKKHELSRSAMVYSRMVDHWFKSSETIIKDKEDELNQQIRLTMPDSHPRADAEIIVDAAEIVHWYQYQIYVKLMRALQGKYSRREDELVGMPKDSDGSAKVALIAIDRSIGAWGVLQSHFDEAIDAILNIQVHLERLRTFTEKVFPQARSFQRPGFDVVPEEKP